MRKSVKCLLALAGLCALGSAANAQLAISPVGTAFNDILATGTALAGIGDDVEINISMATLSAAGFAGNELLPLTNIRVGNNGAVLWNATTGDVGYINRTDFLTMAPLGPVSGASGNGGNQAGVQMVCPLWDDNTPGTGGSIRWQVIGGDLIIQWSNEDHFNAAGSGTVTYQMVVHSGVTIASGNPLVTFAYRDTLYDVARYQNDGGSATIGFKNWGVNPAVIDVEYGLGGGTNTLADPAYGDASMQPKVAGSLAAENPAFPTALAITGSGGGGSYPPTGVGSATPNPVEAGSNVTLRVNVTPGGNPTSVTLGVTMDLQSLGLTSSETLLDDGLNDDGGAGDNVFGKVVSVPMMGDTNLSLPFTVSDDQSRSSNGTLGLTVVAPVSWDELADGGGDAGELPASAQSTASGVGPFDNIAGTFDTNDVDMYLIGICDTGAFSATTFNAYTTVDTQLWLFNLDGTGVVYNDDVPDGFPGDATLQSRISGTFVPAAGNYYLAVSRYNRDPVDEFGALIWANTPFNFERTPDGASPAAPVFGWTGTTTGGAPYRIVLTGACFPVIGPTCDGDVNCDFALDGFDVEVQERAVGGDTTDYCQPDPDFNGDFALDGFDVEAVELVVGGGPCP